MSTMIRVILVVDDEPDILSLVKISLELTADWTIITANSGHEGIFQANTKYPDVILSDIDMPQMNGIEMLRELRQSPTNQSIPAILLTGRSNEMGTQKYVDLGVKTVISKPFDPLTLANQIVQAVNISGV